MTKCLIKALSRPSVCLFVFCFVFSGCTYIPAMPAYESLSARQLPPSDVVILETKTVSKKEKGFLDVEPDFSLVSVDGDVISKELFSGSLPQKAILTPGSHVVRVMYKRARAKFTANFKFSGKPGQKIVVASENFGVNYVKVWLKDSETGEALSNLVVKKPKWAY